MDADLVLAVRMGFFVLADDAAHDGAHLRGRVLHYDPRLAEAARMPRIVRLLAAFLALSP